MGNRNSSSNSKVHGQAAKVPSTEPHHVPRQGKPKAEAPGALRGQHGVGVHSEQQSKSTPLVNDDTITNFIQHAKYKIRTMTMSNSKSTIGREQSNTAPAPAPPALDEGTNSKENQKDPFSDFIQLAKKKFRTTSSIRKNSSSRRG